MLLPSRFFDDKILATWLGEDIKVLCNLTVALCHSSASWKVNDLLSKFKRNELGGGSLPNYLRWVAYNKVSIDSLDVWVVDIGRFPFSDQQLTAHSFHSVRSLEISGCRRDDDVSPELLRQFLAMFPSLKKFTGGESTTDQHLDVLREMGYNLSELMLTECPKLSATAISLLIRSIASSLEVLHCNYLDDHVLNILSRKKSKWKCRRLHTLQMDCRHVLKPVHIFDFCRSVGGTLRSLWLEIDLDNLPDDDHNCLTSQLAKEIAKECKQLTSFHYGSLVDGDDLAVILKSAPQIHELTAGDENVFTFSTETNSWTIETIEAAAVSSISAPVSHLRLCDHEGINSDWFYFLAVQFGKHLIELSCALDKKVDDRMMLWVLPLLSNIEEFEFYTTSGFCFIGDYVANNITEATLSLLPTCCPKIKNLSIQAKIADAGMCSILDGYKGSNLSELRLAGCTLLTDVTLKKIADTFPAIHHLNMKHTSITKETVLTLFCTKLLPVKDMLLPEAIPPREEMDWVCKEYHRFLGIHQV